ncbi:hypothetical protein G1H11_14135 [Phytoactinopolyspora alkaliphila]|uniref:Phage tail protein n=1 Tax=Phytoactinopolyspora alkaliphila TaxID=1783498 RepID=A0A6N9YNC4_9ACTN|nr:hypothetical protein [Phytoactinopolyspora alkaliphila]NED96445.1 hypothetical protein [Phytoactinopolyspora alkaliphila]
MGERAVHENNVAVWFLAGGVASSDLSEVTEAELSAAVEFTELTSDGLGINPTNNNASIAMLRSGKIGQKPGTRQKDINLRFARNTPDGDGDEAWDLFEYGLEGDIIVHRFGLEPSTGAPLEVYRGTSHDPTPIASAQDTYQQFEVPFPLDDWNDKATLVTE